MQQRWVAILLHLSVEWLAVMKFHLPAVHWWRCYKSPASSYVPQHQPSNHKQHCWPSVGFVRSFWPAVVKRYIWLHWNTKRAEYYFILFTSLKVSSSIVMNGFNKTSLFSSFSEILKYIVVNTVCHITIICFSLWQKMVDIPTMEVPTIKTPAIRVLSSQDWKDGTPWGCDVP